MLTGTHPVPGLDHDEPIDCGFRDNVMVHPSTQPEQWEGYINQCELICDGLGPIVHDAESAKNAIKTLLNGFVTIVNEQFAVRFPDANSCMFDETDVWVDPKGRFDTSDGWVNSAGNTCRIEDRCGQLVTNIYGEVATFEEILGEEFPDLDHSFEMQMKGLNETNKETGLYKDLYRTGIFGFEKFIIPSKREHRQKDWDLKWPDNKRRVA